MRYLVCWAVLLLGAALGRSAEPPVEVHQDGTRCVLSNGVLAAQIDPTSGTLVSLSLHGTELLAGGGRGYWSQVGSGVVSGGKDSGIGGYGPHRSAQVVPAATAGEQAEVVCRCHSRGEPGALPADVDLGYVLRRGEATLWCYAVWRHGAGQPAFSVGEARYCLKLDGRLFDHLSVDRDRDRDMPSGADWDQGSTLNMKEARRLTTGPHAGEVEHKYDYAAVLADLPAYGWSSRQRQVGVWLINPSAEYLAGGPTKVELTGHLDGNPGGLPTLLNMWHGSHYGGSVLQVAADEPWTKVIGPFAVYCNDRGDPAALWRQALAQAAEARAAWPPAWFAHADFPSAAGRGSVTGRVRLDDPGAPGVLPRDLQVGLAAPDEPLAASDGFPAAVDWQRDAKHYQYWGRTAADGTFQLGAVRPGRYRLHAFASNVLGELTHDDVVVAAGQTLALGDLTWRPVRLGRTLWELGEPDRTAHEFRHGDHYWQWGLYQLYPREFPHDVDFVIGLSDPRRDWNYCQPPRMVDGRATPTTWRIRFDLAGPVKGRATLRLAFAGARSGCSVAVAVNGRPAGETGPLPSTGVMHRDGIRGYWCERPVAFDGSLLAAGRNTLALTSTVRDWTSGVLYDYLRLELADAP